MKTLVLGSGAREDAIAHALSRSRIVSELHAAPGNPGMARVATLHRVDPCSAGEVVGLCMGLGIELVVIGPEAPLAKGVADALRANGIKAFGPGAAGARLEASKSFAKDFMTRNHIPTAAFACCATFEECKGALAARKPPYVIKADGLAAGKGVFICDTIDEALDTCSDIIETGALGDAGDIIIIEDFTKGVELTVLALTDGENFITLPPSRDHKRIFDGDGGPNTGGMGAYSPVPDVDAATLARIEDTVVKPTIAGLKREKIDYCGVIYAGLMLTPDGGISLLEYNARMGDPETQAVLSSFGGDFGEAVLACCDGRIGDFAVPDAPQRYSVGVVLASHGYPGAFTTGHVISGLDKEVPGTQVYHAGTQQAEDGSVVTSGGRVLTVVGTADSPAEALRLVYERVDRIGFEGMYYRKDIAKNWRE